MSLKPRESFVERDAREQAEHKANVALCASEGHGDPLTKMYVTICSRCRKVLSYR
jgi:hypothetical protein